MAALESGKPEPVELADCLLAEVFSMEDDICGRPPEEHPAVQQERHAPIMMRMLVQLAKGSKLAKAIRCILKHWDTLTVFPTGGRITLTASGVEGMTRSMAKGRNRWMHAGSVKHTPVGAGIRTLLQTARLNSVDTEARLLCTTGHMPGR